jgi:hypothetical protein
MSFKEQWKSTPRAVKWAGGAALILVAYFALSPLWTWMSHLDNTAFQLELALKRHANLSSDKSSDGAEIENIHEKLGAPQKPGKLKPEAFARVVNGILDRHDVKASTNERKVRLAPTTSEALQMGAVDRLILEVTFEASPDVVVAILSDLEKAPEVAAVSRIRIDKSNSRDETAQTVRATIAPEAWVLATDTGSAGVTQ